MWRMLEVCQSLSWCLHVVESLQMEPVLKVMVWKWEVGKIGHQRFCHQVMWLECFVEDETVGLTGDW